MRLFTPVFTVLFVAAGCGGNWSNKDLEFVNALPTRTELKAKLPVPSSTTSPLEGVQTRQDGLNVGDPSSAYANAKTAQTQFNGLLDFLLGVVDTVRMLPPTSRTAASRTWGPWPDKDNPGFEFQVRITQKAEYEFEWAIEARPKSGSFIAIVTGTYTATNTVKHGVGAFIVHVADFRDVLKVTPELAALDEIDVNYATQAFPTTVSMLFKFRLGAITTLSDIGIDYSEWADKSGKLTFKFHAPANVDATGIALTADWMPNGVGRATGLVTEGLQVGANVQECWDTGFKVVYYTESWNPASTSGNPVDCVVVAHPPSP